MLNKNLQGQTFFRKKGFIEPYASHKKRPRPGACSLNHLQQDEIGGPEGSFIQRVWRRKMEVVEEFTLAIDKAGGRRGRGKSPGIGA